MTVSFPNLGIQCVKRKDIKEALTVRENQKIDPFGSKFELETFEIYFSLH